MTEAEIAAYRAKAQGWMPGQGEPRPRYADMHETKEFMPLVIELAKACGWRVYHTHDSQRSEAGFPDLVMVRRPRLLFVELKRERGVMTAPQQDWFAELSMTATEGKGIEVELWRPAHWHDGTVEGVLR